jgi:hypothetical protein
MKKDGKRGTFKWLDKNRPVKGDGRKGEKIQKKRKMDTGEEAQEDGAKKVKAAEVVEKNQISVDKNAGPLDRSCRTQ